MAGEVSVVRENRANPINAERKNTNTRYSRYVSNADIALLANKVREQFDPSEDDLRDSQFVSEMEDWAVDAIHDWEESRATTTKDGYLGLSYGGYRNLASDITEYLLRNKK